MILNTLLQTPTLRLVCFTAQATSQHNSRVTSCKLFCVDAVSQAFIALNNVSLTVGTATVLTACVKASSLSVINVWHAKNVTCGAGCTDQGGQVVLYDSTLTVNNRLAC